MTDILPAIWPETPGNAPDPTAAERARYSVLTANRKAQFLQNLQLFGNVRLACKAACISAQTAYRARRASEGFALAWDAALLAARAQAEAVLADRALNGVEEAVYYHGEEVARRRRFDSRLLLAHLARLDRLEARPEVTEAVGRLDQCIEALMDGAEIDTLIGPEMSRETGSVTGSKAARDCVQEGVPCVPSRRKADADAGSGGCAGEGAGGGLDADAGSDSGEDDLPELERRLQAMEAERPANAPSLAEQASNEPLDGCGMGDLEAAQLAAFEAGEPRWWEAGTHASALGGAALGEAALAEEASEKAQGEAREPALSGAGLAFDDLKLHAGMAALDDADLGRSCA